MTDDTHSPIRRQVIALLARLFLIAAVVASIAFVWSLITWAQRGPQASAGRPQAIAPASSTRIAFAVTPTPTLPPVAIVAGHSGGNDPGAMCKDGLREVEITTDVSQRARDILEARGYYVEILAEFDQRLSAARRDYAPRAFLAIHADSCVTYASGYKVARAANSAIPNEDDRLVRCLTNAYAAVTQLPFHAGSITNDMTMYHGLNEISPQSPAAIIELGFMGSDSNLLRNRRDTLAQGVADGLDDFLIGRQCK